MKKKYTIMLTTLAQGTKLNWRTELKSWAPEDLHEPIDLGVFDYLFKVASLNEKQLRKAASELLIK